MHWQNRKYNRYGARSSQISSREIGIAYSLYVRVDENQVGLEIKGNENEIERLPIHCDGRAAPSPMKIRRDGRTICKIDGQKIQKFGIIDIL